VVEQVARGRSIFGIFGAYQVASSSNYSAGQVIKWFLYHLSELDLSLGVLPFAALLVLAFSSRTLPRPQRVFVVTTVAVTFWLVLEVAAFASEQSFRVEERNMFYVAPLFLIALLIWIDRGLPRGSVWATAAIIVAAALPGALPYSSFIGLNALSDTIALIPLGWIVERGLEIDDVGLVVVLVSAALGLLFLLVPRRYAWVTVLLVLTYFAVSQASIQAKHRQQSLESLYGGISSPPLARNWIDRKVGSNANVSVVWTGNTDKFTIWENEIFNRSVGTVYATGPPLPGDLAETPVKINGATGFLLGPGGKRIRARYALADTSLALKGTVIAQDVNKRMRLYRVNGPLQQISRVTGLYADTWSGRDVTYTRLDCRGGHLLTQLQSDPNLFHRPNVVTVEENGAQIGRAVVRPTGTTALQVALTPQNGRCTVHFRVRRTAVPAVVLGHGNTDTRALGAHFNRFVYRPS